MKKPILIFISLVIAMTTLAATAGARDLRQAAIQSRQELEETQARNQAVTNQIQKDRQTLLGEIQSLKARVDTLENTRKTNQNRLESLRRENAQLVAKAQEDQGILDELSGAVRVSAGNLKSLLAASMYTAQNPQRLDLLSPILDTNRFPGMDDMETLAALFLEETRLTAGIDLNNTEFIAASGEKVAGQVLTLGGFTAAYHMGEEFGFLNYSPESRQLYALSALPSRRIQKNLKAYMGGETDQVFLDISRGGALRQITHKQSLKDQIRKGGMLVWPILALGVLAVIIGIERGFFLWKVHSNTDTVMGRVNELAAQGEWETCDQMVGHKKIPVYNVLRAGLAARKESRDTLESILQESILKELPRLERFLPMLNIMGAIAPLLGLLGTVTGMIATFHVITLYGTGDPRMMSGGISTALVTTMLGLAVAIPIMLLYTLLCRQVEHVIGDMEEKAVALTNIIFREVK